MVEDSITNAKIKVLGIGGAGNNAVNRMKREKLDTAGVELIVVNTDLQALDASPVENKLLIGPSVTHGLGAGAVPEVGRQAAEDSLSEIKNRLRGADMVFIAAGMGGGTGTGAAPVVARACREMDILTIGIVTRPFGFEGKKRNDHALEGLTELRKHVDSLIVIRNDQLLHLMGTLDVDSAFAAADDVLCHSVRIISSIVFKESRINLDFADIKTIMKDKGTALIGMGKGSGDNRASDAAHEAISSALLEASIKGAKNAIVNVTYNHNMTLLDTHEAVEIVREASENPDINIIFGTTKDEYLDADMMVTVIATDFMQGDLYKCEQIDEHINIDELGKEIEHINTDEIGQEVENEMSSNSLNLNENVVETKQKRRLFPSFFAKRGKK